MGVLTNLSLFSGAGGFDLGAKIAGGFRTVCYVEKDRYAQGALMSRIRDEGLDRAPIWDDVSTFEGREWRGSVDIISGGFPCQDLSIVGRQEGIAGSRSGLWKEYLRIIREVRPRFVFVENVAGLLMGGAIGVVLGDLASSGFDAEWSCFSASQVGAPHKRERVWIVAYPNGLGRVGMGKDEKDFCSGIIAESSQTWRDVPFDISLPVAEKDADAVPGVLRMDDGLAEELDRIRLTGNGVVSWCSVPGWRKIKHLGGI